MCTRSKVWFKGVVHSVRTAGHICRQEHHADYRDGGNWGTTKPATYIEWSTALTDSIPYRS